jgi:hypothetical protein
MLNETCLKTLKQQYERFVFPRTFLSNSVLSLLGLINVSTLSLDLEKVSLLSGIFLVGWGDCNIPIAPFAVTFVFLLNSASLSPLRFHFSGHPVRFIVRR